MSPLLVLAGCSIFVDFPGKGTPPDPTDPADTGAPDSADTGDSTPDDTGPPETDEAGEHAVSDLRGRLGVPLRRVIDSGPDDT